MLHQLTYQATRLITYAHLVGIGGAFFPQGIYVLIDGSAETRDQLLDTGNVSKRLQPGGLFCVLQWFRQQADHAI